MIRELTLPNTTTDADLASVGRMSTLKRLSIQHCENVTDEGITHLGDLPNLEELNLWYSKRIGDRSVATLKKLKSLKKLNIEGTAIGGSAIEELKESLAACEIRAR